jgi:hypothetical protein
MAFNRNFTRVSVGVDPMTGANALFVEGRSDPPDDCWIMVGVSQDAGPQTAPVPNPNNAVWEATIPEGATPFNVGDKVFVFGVAMRDAPHDPFTWHDKLKVEAK